MLYSGRGDRTRDWEEHVERAVKHGIFARLSGGID